MQAQAFSPLSIPIKDTNLVEASAGTGKTWGITALFARLLVLEKIPVNQILVVTFTKAATAELQNRLRARLEEILSYLNHQDAEKTDSFIVQLIEQAKQEESHSKLILRIKAALSQFDNASIYTIHGFCQRVLRDYAFLCDVPFEMEIQENNQEIWQAAAEQFWRKHVSANTEMANLTAKYQLNLQEICQGFQPYLANPHLSTRYPDVQLAAVQKIVQTAWNAVAQQFEQIENTFWECRKQLNGNKFRTDTYQRKFDLLRQKVQSHTLPSAEEIFDVLFNKDKQNVFEAEFLQANLKAKASIPQEQLNVLCQLGNLLTPYQNLIQAEKDTLIAFQLDIFNMLKTTIEERKKSHHQRSFEDLLLDTYHALTQSKHHQQLAQLLSNEWQVALIDEFQDTDPLQYHIFRTIFIEHQRPLFLVGDPKQAIYRFRGADIYAYLAAANDAQQHYTLETNFRSHSKLVNSITYLFQKKHKPFILNNIHYPAVKAARETCRLHHTQQTMSAIELHWLLKEDEVALTKKSLQQRSAHRCANDIALKLQQASEHVLLYQEQPLQAGQIAILVRTHHEANLVAKALKQRHIQSVMVQNQSVFHTAEAEALIALLNFWNNPSKTEHLRFVLSSILLEWTAAQLQTLNQNDTQLAEHAHFAATAFQLWQSKGIYAALNRFVEHYRLVDTLLAKHNERSLSNFQQLMEILAQEEEHSHTPASMIQWLKQQTQSSLAREHVLRLESDENLVKIVTMHASKGLQYPIVYCPFVWDSRAYRKQAWQTVYHSSVFTELLEKSQLSDTNLNQLQDENIGEDLRLLYVALTRAEEQLILYIAPCNTTDSNPLTYLLEGDADTSRIQVEQSFQVSPERLAEKLKNNYLEHIQSAPSHTDLGQLHLYTDQDDEIISYLAHQAPSSPYQATHWQERAFQSIRQTSFTALTQNLNEHHQAHEAMQPSVDYAETNISATPSSPITKTSHQEQTAYTRFSFPKGAASGVCLHEILESILAEQNHTDADSIHHIVQNHLNKHGIADSWFPTVCSMVQQTLHTPLPDQNTLASLPVAQRLSEMDFVMQINQFALHDVQQYIQQSQLPTECKQAAYYLNFETLKGFLNGFIDLTAILADGNACIIDYKSNHLGMDFADYQTQSLNQAVAHHHYYLQALIYAIAVARYLKQRQALPPTIHILYLFMRGLNENNTNGIWRWDIDTQSLAPWLNH